MHSVYPYGVPLYNRLCAAEAYTFQFFFEALKTSRRIWKVDTNAFLFNFSLLKSVSINSLNDKYISIDIIPRLISYNPDFIISYGFGITNLQALIYAIFFNKKFIIWGEMPLQIESKRSFSYKIYRKFFTHFCSAGLASSTQTIDYFNTLGIPKKYLSLLTVERIQAPKIVQSKYLDKKDRMIFLTVGSVEYRKGFDLLIKTFERVKSRSSVEIVLKIVGNTNIEPEYKKTLVPNENSNVEFIDFSDDISKFYLEADLFLLFTRRDAHAMVIPEAMSFGLPVICSKFAGCVSDFIMDNGLVIDPYEIEKNAEALSNLIANPFVLYKMALKSLEMMTTRLNINSAENIIHMLEDLS